MLCEDTFNDYASPLSATPLSLLGRSTITIIFLSCYGHHRDLHSFPTRRSSDPGHSVEWPRWGPDDEVATRRAYGEALAALGAERGDVVALDGEVSNSTYSEIFAKAHPDRYFEMFIAEQQMIAAAVGMQVRGFRPFASTFAAFLSRAYDFVRMAAISRAHICLA